MKLSLSKCAVLHSALLALDGHKKITKSASGGEIATDVAYAFTPSVRFAIAKNISLLSSIQETFVAAQNGLVRQFSDGRNEVPKDRMGDYNAARAELLDQEEDCDLAMFSYDDLKTEVNPIPGSVIAALMPLIKE